MGRKQVSGVGIALLVLMLVVTACGGGASNGDGSAPVDNGNGAATPEPTISPVDLFPDTLPIHPEAYEFEANVPSNTYSYRMPGMVQETVDYLEPELEALGWVPIGAPSVMGHLATFTMRREGYNLSVSMQDNELSESTRVQMIVNKQ